MVASITPTSTTASPGPEAPDAHQIAAPGLSGFIYALFFTWGGITSLNDVLIPKLKELFQLDHAAAMLVQTAFFLSYALFSMPAASIVRRAGYMWTAVVGLLCMAAGCLLFIPAAAFATFGLFLVALFVLGAGITVLQVAANPLIALLGPARTAHSRLTFAQAFNSLGTTIFPRVGSALILGGMTGAGAAALSGAALDAYRRTASQTIAHAYLGLALALLLVAAVVWSRRHRLPRPSEENAARGESLSLLRQPRFAYGAACIFLYVGAEVAIGSLIVSYLMQPDVWGVDDRTAGNHIFYYWGLAMVGRFIGAGLLRYIPPGVLLAAVAAGAIGLILLSANSAGALAGWALLFIGFMNSIMFPTIFGLASEGLGPKTPTGSGIMVTAIVGGAVIPWLTGRLADASTLRFGLLVPALCYLAIVGFGIVTRRRVAPA